MEIEYTSETPLLDSTSFSMFAYRETSEITRLDDDVIFTNGMMVELKKHVLFDPIDGFFNFMKLLLPQHLVDVIQSQTVKQFKDKIKKFDGNEKKYRKTPSKFKEFCSQTYNFGLAADRSNQCAGRRLNVAKHKVACLSMEKKDLLVRLEVAEEKLVSTEQTLVGTEQTLVGAEESIDFLNIELENKVVLENKVESLEQKTRRLSCQVAGFKSGKVRKASTLESSRNSSAKFQKLESCSVGVGTSLSVIDKDLLIIEQSESRILRGQMFSDFGGRKSTSGHVQRYANLGQEGSLPCSKVQKKEIQKRSKLLDSVIDEIASGDTNDKKLLLTSYVRQNKDLFTDILQDSGFTLLTKISPVEAINIQALLRLPTNRVRNLRVALNKLNCNVFPSERLMRNEKAKVLSHIEDAVESGMINLYKTATSDNVVPCAYVKIENLVDYIEKIILKDVDNYVHDDLYFNRWWIYFGGDKGGQHMKFHFQIINSKNAGSVDNVHIYCMFEATDSVDNMIKVWTSYREQVQLMMEDNFQILDRNVLIFLGGDYHFLDDMVGHQGSSSTYPCSLDLVTLKHLQNHGGYPHSPDTCKVEVRTVRQYHENLAENRADDRSNGNLRDNGKFHYNVVGPMIFPLRSMTQLVPSSLHILLGVVLYLYKMILKICQDIDSTNERFDAIKLKLNQEYELKSLELSYREQDLRDHGENIVEIINWNLRNSAVMNLDLDENLRLAQGSDNRRSRRVVQNDRCSSESCVITQHDVNVQWVQCDTCTKWYHIMCEAITPVEQLGLGDNYECVNCSNLIRHEVFEVKIAALIDEEDRLNSFRVDAQVASDDAKALYDSVIGEKERTLNEALDKIKVTRQAYHGSVFVGNHCVIVLKSYDVLVDVIQVERPGEADKFRRIFYLFNDIMKYVMARRFLDTDEVDEVVKLCHQFGHEYPVLFPDASIIRKIHELVFNVPKFIRRFKTIGLLSEQEGESKHASINAELRSLCCVRSHAERIRMAMVKDELRSFADKTLIQSVPRRCTECPERAFLRAGKDKTRRCPVCIKKGAH